MVEISEYAYQKLFKTLGDNLTKSTEYGSPPIFYWYQRMLQESYKIEECRYLRKGVYKYQLGNSLGIAHVQCDYVGRQRFLIITDYEINTRTLFSWKYSTQKGGLIPKPPIPRPKKPYRKLTAKPLFGYSFVMNDKKQYNFDKDGNLLTRWFNAIKTPFQQPYGKYQLIAYINNGGYAYALGLDGKIYNLNRNWKDIYTESIYSMAFAKMITEEIDIYTKETIRLTESRLRNIIQESICKVLYQIQ